MQIRRRWVIALVVTVLAAVVLENVLSLTFDAAAVVLAAALVLVTVQYANATNTMAESQRAQVDELRRQTELSRELAERQTVAAAWADVWRSSDALMEAKHALEDLPNLQGKSYEEATRTVLARLDSAQTALDVASETVMSLAAGLPKAVEEPCMLYARALLHVRGACVYAVSGINATNRKDDSDYRFDAHDLESHWMTACRDEIPGSPTWASLVSGSFADAADELHNDAWKALYEFLHPSSAELT